MLKSTVFIVIVYLFVCAYVFMFMNVFHCICSMCSLPGEDERELHRHTMQSCTVLL